VAKSISAALRAAGVVVWLDQSELRGGDVWDARIQHQINNCTVFLPIISAQSQGRREGYFRLEWRLADERMRRMALETPFLAPVAVDNILERNALVPRSFLHVHWTRLNRGEVGADFVRHVQALLVQGTLRGETLMRGPTDTEQLSASKVAPVPPSVGLLESGPAAGSRPMPVEVPSRLGWWLLAAGLVAGAVAGAWMFKNV